MEFYSISLKECFTSAITYGLMFTLTSIFIWYWWNTGCFAKNGKKIPGPVGLPVVGYLPFLGGKEPHKVFQELQKKFGNIFGLYLGKRYLVIVNEYTAAKEILTNPAAYDRGPGINVLPLNGFIFANGAEWHEQRRFSMSVARDIGFGSGNWEDAVMEDVSRILQVLHQQNGQPLVISTVLGNSFVSIVLSLLFGRRIDDIKEKEKVKNSIMMLNYSMRHTMISSFISLFPGMAKLCEILKIGEYDKIKASVQDFLAFIQEEIEKHKTSAKQADVLNFIDIYLEKISEMTSKENRTHFFSERTLEGNLTALFVGASDTVVSSMVWLIRLMAKYKDVQSSVYKELVETVGKDGRARLQDKDIFPITSAVLMEAHRYSSIVPLSPPRRLNRALNYKGYHISKGTCIVSNLWALHHDPKYWKNPEIFSPDRFLTDNATQLIKQIPSYLPFSIGKRNCPGETIASTVLLLYFSEIVKNFEITPPDGVEVRFDKIPGFVEHLLPQPLCFKARKYLV